MTYLIITILLVLFIFFREIHNIEPPTSWPFVKEPPLSDPLDSAEPKVVCPNFGRHALTSSFAKYRFLQIKDCLAKIVNGLPVLKLFQLSNGVLLCS